MGAEAVQCAVLHVPGKHAAANTLLVHQEVERKIFDEELGVVFQALLVERVQGGVTGSVGRGTSALRHLLSVAYGLAAKGALINSAIFGARERNAVMFQLQYRGHGLPAHVLDGVLVAEPIGTLDRVVHVETPIVAVAHIAEPRGHAALRGDSMTARREDFCDASRLQSRRGHSQCGPQPPAAGTADPPIIPVLNDFASLPHRPAPAANPS